jgi:histidyl-tRNA synthetase
MPPAARARGKIPVGARHDSTHTRIQGYSSRRRRAVAAHRAHRRGAASVFGYGEIRVPIMEKTELFARSIGEDTDIVEKEMYTFADRKGELLTLRPRPPPPSCAPTSSTSLYAPTRCASSTPSAPCSAASAPRKGRYRQFYQINAEIFGIASPLYRRPDDPHAGDAVPASGGDRRRRPPQLPGLPGVPARISGRPCWPAGHGQGRRFCAATAAAASARNPCGCWTARCPACREAWPTPVHHDYLCATAAPISIPSQASLTGWVFPTELDKRLVRGLDYYTRTTFEIQTGALGAQSAVAGGGRYDGLVQALGGPASRPSGLPSASTGWWRSSARPDHRDPAAALFIAALGEAAKADGLPTGCAALGRPGGAWRWTTATAASKPDETGRQAGPRTC